MRNLRVYKNILSECTLVPMWALSSTYFPHYPNNYKVLLLFYLGYSNLAQNVIFKKIQVFSIICYYR